MNKAFSLIEIILYISLLSVLIIGVFSFVMSSVDMSMNKPVFRNDDYQQLIKNYHE